MTTEDERDRLSLLVHEVRSPTAALAAIAVALDDDALDQATTRGLLELAVAACRGIERIVGDAALGPLRVEEIDLGAIAREAATVAALGAGGARVRAVVDSDGTLVRGDPVRLRQALDNLVVNALSYSPPGEDVVVRVCTVGDAVVVAISDQGVGIPVAEQSRIFEPGVRLGTEGVGLGLGLPIARAIVEAHGGTLTIESAPGKGATFTLTLPQPGT